MDESRNPWTRLGSRQVYANDWIRLREDRVIRPDGQAGIYGVVEMRSWAIGAIPLTPEGDTFLVGQYRYTLDQYSWEIPEGGGSPSDSPLESARRELLEETGIAAARWTFLGEAHLSNSVTTELGCAFLAEDLTFGPAAPDGTEELRVRRLPFAEAVAMALRGEITDSLSIIGLLRAKHFLDSGRRWTPVARAFPEFGTPPSA
jgi:8-oxo-dGTP pyrophosphatase MutT (NUDIX family)